MTCRVEQRNAVRKAAERCGQLAGTVATDVLAPATGYRDTWTCELVLEGNRIPPAVLRACTEVGVSILPGRTGTRGSPSSTVVVVVSA